MVIERFYKSPGLLSGQLTSKLQAITQVSSLIEDLETEFCYYIESPRKLSADELKIVEFTLTSPFEVGKLRNSSGFEASNCYVIVKIGPRLNFSTAFSSNAASIFESAGLSNVKRVERATRYIVKCREAIGKDVEEAIVNVLQDKMTECRYFKPIETFDHGFRPENWFEVDVLQRGRQALEDVNTKLGLAFDDWDLDFYTNLFKTKLNRNPTSVECFDLAQSYSEHSRHWFFCGKMIIDGQKQKETLFQLITDTQSTSNQNNVIKFADNSSAIEGFEVKTHS